MLQQYRHGDSQSAASHQQTHAEAIKEAQMAKLQEAQANLERLRAERDHLLAMRQQYETMAATATTAHAQVCYVL